MHIVTSTTKFNDNNFSYIKITNEALHDIMLMPLYTSLDINEIIGHEVLLYSYAKDQKNYNAKIGIVEKIVKLNDCVKILLKNIEDANITCNQVNKAIIRFKFRNGIKESKGYTYFLDDDQFNCVLFPEDKGEKKYQDLRSKLASLKEKSKWLEMIKLFGNLDDFERNYPDLYSNEEFLDNFVVYPLSQLVTPGDKYKVRKQYEKYFFIFSDRTLELFPNNISYLSVRAYAHYSRYLSNNLSFEKEYNDAKTYLEKILSVNKNHSTSLFRLARLQQEYLDNKKFDYFCDKQELRKTSEGHYQKFIEIYNSGTEEFKKNNKKNYNKSIYNLAKLKLESKLDCEFVFFDKYILGEDVKLFLIEEKEKTILSTLHQMLDLMKFNGFSVKSSFRKLSNLKNIDPLNTMYRISQCYQYLGLFYLMKNMEEDAKSQFEESNNYIKSCFKFATDTENEGKQHINKPTYLHVDRAVNDYFLGDRYKCYERLEKGQSDAWYRGAQLAYFEKNINKANYFIRKIKQKDTKKMLNKALELEKKING